MAKKKTDIYIRLFPENKGVNKLTTTVQQRGEK